LEHGGHDHASHSHEQANNANCDANLIETCSPGTIENNLSEDINLRAAFIHVLGDLVQSVGVLIASGIIWYRDDWRIADPICTLLFSVIVVVSTMFISRDIFRLLMEGI
jgi:zinc transporter 2